MPTLYIGASLCNISDASAAGVASLFPENERPDYLQDDDVDTCVTVPGPYGHNLIIEFPLTGARNTVEVWVYMREAPAASLHHYFMANASGQLTYCPKHSSVNEFDHFHCQAARVISHIYLNFHGEDIQICEISIL